MSPVKTEACVRGKDILMPVGVLLVTAGNTVRQTRMTVHQTLVGMEEPAQTKEAVTFATALGLGLMV